MDLKQLAAFLHEQWLSTRRSLLLSGVLRRPEVQRNQDPVKEARRIIGEMSDMEVGRALRDFSESVAKEADENRCPHCGHSPGEW